MKKGITTTNGQMILWARQLSERMGDVSYMMENRQRIEWFQVNVLPLAQAAQLKLGELQKEYCVFENGQVKINPLSEEEQKLGVQSKPILLEGKTMEDFDKKSNEIWNELKVISI